VTALTARKIGTYPTGSPQWHEARAGKMSGSRIAAAAGISPWTSPFSLFWEMAGLSQPDPSEAMEWGTWLEPVIIDRFAAKHPEIRVIRNPGTWLHKDRPWQLANPDALLVLPGTGARRRPDCMLEVKTTGYADEWGKPGTDEIPVHYLAQVLWYLDTLGLRFCIVAVLIGGNTYREYVVEADPATAAELRTIAREFLDRLEAGIAPDLDGSDATFETIKLLHPEIDGSTVDVPDELALQLVRAKSLLVVPTERMNVAKAELAQFMGSAKTAFYLGSKLADRRSRSGGTPYVQLANNLSVSTVVPIIEREKATA
jgi:putative phage-type endonuclease